jgi:hypothetical protein
VIWALAAALLLAAGFVLLRACDLAIFPLHGLKYCAAPRSDLLEAERARRTQLQAELQQAELTFAQKPICAPPPPPRPEPIPDPLPKPLPQPLPQPHVPDQPAAPEPLKVPQKLSDLRGCWESERGDMDIATDDAERRPIGKVRKCFCFGANGRGQLKLLYTIGVKCRAPVAARLQNGKLTMSYPTFSCVSGGQNYGLVPAYIECENGENDVAACTQHELGQLRTVVTEQYRRVEQDHCGP